MREIEVSRLTEVIEKLCIEANEHLPEDVKDAIKTCRACEDGEIAKVSLITLSRILISQTVRMFRSVRIPEWHAYSLKLARMSTLQAEI